MIHKNNSNKKLIPSKSSHKSSLRIEQAQPKGRWDQTAIKSSSNKSSHSKCSASQSKSKGKEEIRAKIKHQIQKEYTKQTFKRVQHKLNISTKIQQLIEEINQRQAKLSSFFQIYKILEAETGQQRCLQHNNDLSLYCQTQNKILCVHCIYGGSRHKIHKVLPLKDCIRDISRDIVNLEGMIAKDLDSIKTKIKTTQTNQTFIQRHYRQQLGQLQRNFNYKLQQIEADFNFKKQYLNQYFQDIIKKNLSLTCALKDFKKSVNLKLGLLGSDEDNIKPVLDMKQISRQNILTKISQLSNLKGMSIQSINEKDLGQNCLRSRIKTTLR